MAITTADTFGADIKSVLNALLSTSLIFPVDNSFYFSYDTRKKYLDILSSHPATLNKYN
jgi:hypothetical protein